MEFWGVEVKSGETLKVNPGDSRVLHLSQACLGELKKDKSNDSVCLFVNIEGKKLVLGTLSSEKLPQQLFDLVFEKEFELSHNWKNGSVYFYGYKADNPFNESEDEGEFDSEDDEDIPLQIANGKQEIQTKEGKPTAAEEVRKPIAAEKVKSVKESAAGKQKVKIVEPSKGVKADEDEDESSDDLMAEEEDSDSDEDDEDSSDDDSEEDDDSEDEDEETPKKVESGKKKRPLESASKTPVSGKKAKLATPQKTDGKKGGVHVATPHPSKQAGKTPANKSNQKTPTSEGSAECKSCNRTFKSDQALQSHNQAKHTSGK